jgi:hypothetical protein
MARIRNIRVEARAGKPLELLVVCGEAGRFYPCRAAAPSKCPKAGQPSYYSGTACGLPRHLLHGNRSTKVRFFLGPSATVGHHAGVLRRQ